MHCCMASLTIINEHNRILRIGKRELGKGKGIVTMMATQPSLERFLSLYADH